MYKTNKLWVHKLKAILLRTASITFKNLNKTMQLLLKILAKMISIQELMKRKKRRIKL